VSIKKSYLKLDGTKIPIYNRKVPIEIKRSLFNKLYGEIKEPEISILLGARQVGKSTLLRNLQKKAQQEGYANLFFDLEQSSDLEQMSGTQADIVTLFSKTQVVFIDEFPYLPNAFKLFKALYDSRSRIKIYASGSSSIEIHKHLKESLAGRFRKTRIYPLSFSEAKQIPAFNFKEYCRWGGLPGLCHQDSHEKKIDLLENIVSTYITKDIKGLIQEENIRAFNSLLYLLADSQGSVGVVANLARETGLKETTLERYLEIMAQTYVCTPIWSYSNNLANELKKSKKYYLYDIGIRNHLLKDLRDFSAREDQGAILESFVYLQLEQQLQANMEIRFWRTKKGQEVDFIIIKNRVPLPIEVKSHMSHLTVPGGLKSFLKKYPKAPYAIVYNLNQTGKLVYEGRDVYFQNIEECQSLGYMSQIL
jgi:uncharacterized protein